MKVLVSGVKYTPSGASPPAVAVATNVLVPATAPRIQQAPALPSTLVVVDALLANAPHVPAVLLSTAVVPAPSPMLKLTGTFWRIIPFAVGIVTCGRHSAGSAVPTTPSRHAGGVALYDAAIGLEASIIG